MWKQCHLDAGVVSVLKLQSCDACFAANTIKSCQCVVVAAVVLLFYVHGKHLRSCRDGQ